MLLCGLCSLLCLFSVPEHTQTPTGVFPVFLAYASPQAATFPAFSVFVFAASQDNHFPLKVMRASQTVPKAYSAQTIHPSKTPLRNRLVFCLASFQFKYCLVPCHKGGIWRPWAQRWLCLLPIRSPLWPFLLGNSSIPAAHHGIGWDGKEIAKQDPTSQTYHFLCSHRRPAGITTPKYFLLGHGQ